MTVTLVDYKTQATVILKLRLDITPVAGDFIQVFSKIYLVEQRLIIVPSERNSPNEILIYVSDWLEKSKEKFDK